AKPGLAVGILRVFHKPPCRFAGRGYISSVTQHSFRILEREKMMRRALLLCILAAGMVFSLARAESVRADVKLPAVIGSHIGRQRDQPLPIWGWADPGEEVTVQFDGQQQTAKSDELGLWRVTLRPVKADGKAHRMTIKGKNTIELEDILIGEVWL